MESAVPRDTVAVLAFDVSKVDAVAVSVGASGHPVPDALDRLRVADGLDDAERLTDLLGRARQHVARLAPSRVALVDTTKTNQWKLSDLRPRVELETVLLLAATAQGVPALRVSQHTCLKPTGAARTTEIADRVASAVDLTGFTRKDRRALAVAAAWTLLGLNRDDVRTVR